LGIVARDPQELGEKKSPVKGTPHAVDEHSDRPSQRTLIGHPIGVVPDPLKEAARIIPHPSNHCRRIERLRGEGTVLGLEVGIELFQVSGGLGKVGLGRLLSGG
jgi:hypothetical protein